MQAQVRSGRFGSASEVVSEGLRLLEESEQRALVERWLLGDLGAADARRVRPALLRAARAHMRGLIEAGLEDVKAGRLIDGPSAMEELRGVKSRRRSA